MATSERPPAPGRWRIVLAVPRFPKLSETFVVRHFVGLWRAGWDVRVVCQGGEAGAWRAFPELAAIPGVRRRIHRALPQTGTARAATLLPLALLRGLAAAPGTTLRFLRRPGSAAARLKRLYLDLPYVLARPDLLHFEFGSLGAERIDVKPLLGCRAVVSFRGYDLAYVGLDDPAYYAGVWRDADALHLLGEDLWQRALHRGCPPQMPRALIPPAVDAEAFDPGERPPPEPAGSPERPLRVASVGRLEWKKGYEHALVALRRLLDDGVAVRHRIVGDGAFREAVAFARHQLGLEEVVELAGATTRDGVLATLRWGDVFLHAAVSEGFGNAVLEAQAMALPVVVSDADGLAENVADGVTGFVVPRRDPAALAAKLTQLARDPALRLRMGAAGRARVAERFRPLDEIAAFEALYRRVLGGAA